MRADTDKHEDLESSEVVSSHPSRSVIHHQSSSPPASSSPPGRCQSPVSQNHTPLLTASLNAPPQTYYGGLNGNVRLKNHPTEAVISISSSKTKKSDSSTDSQYSSDSTSQGLSTRSSHSQAVFYSTLLKQLRQKAGDGVGNSNNSSSGPTAQQIHVVPVKIKKEKGGSGSMKSLPFMCPACKKRFQRHIAMNAHFQNEHIGPASSSGERSCKLCGITASSLNHVRNHLRTAHNIDLDNPAKCLVEDPSAFTTSKYSVLEASLRSGCSNNEDSSDLPSCSNIDMSDVSRSSSPLPVPAHSQSHVSPRDVSSSEQSPERSLFPIKQDGYRGVLSVAEDDNSQVEDLSLRRHIPNSPILGRSSSFSPAPRSPRAESPTISGNSKASKRPRLRDGAQSPTCHSHVSSEPSTPPPHMYTCTHCNISYPNQTLYFLHKGFHSDSNPWRCNGCGHQCTDLYDFNSHLFSVAHQ